MKSKMFDIVALSEDLESENLKKGYIGTIIEIFSYPNTAYEVEFIDDYGVTLKQLTLLPSQISAFSK